MSAAKDYLSLPMREFLDDLAAKSPTPGGGSVAALVGCLAAAQGRMVIEYTLGKRAFAPHEDQLRRALEDLKRAGDMFGQLMAEDMAAYESFAKARASSDGEQRQRALAVAVEVPMEIIVLAGAVAARLDGVKAIVNPQLLSDLRVSAILAYASGRAACTSVRMNLKEMTDTREVERLENQLDLLVGRAGRHRNAVVHYQAAPA